MVFFARFGVVLSRVRRSVKFTFYIGLKTEQTGTRDVCLYRAISQKNLKSNYFRCLQLKPLPALLREPSRNGKARKVLEELDALILVWVKTVLVYKSVPQCRLSYQAQRQENAVRKTTSTRDLRGSIENVQKQTNAKRQPLTEERCPEKKLELNYL